MMKTIKETLELALEALITINNAIYVNSLQEAAAVYKANDAITALKEALTSVPDWASEAIEQPSGGATIAPVAKPHEQEPIAYLHQCGKKPELKELSFKKNEPLLAAKGYKAIPLTSPPIEAPPLAQRKPLTDEEIDAIADEYLVDYRIPAGCALNFARDIEAAHGITAAPQLKENT
jgi:hypothetical protein